MCKIWIGWLFCIVVWPLLGCQNRTKTILFDLSQRPDSTNVSKSDRIRKTKSCADWRGYLPDSAYSGAMPIRRIRVNFHIMNSRDSSQNFKETDARRFFTSMLEWCNLRLDSNIRNWRSVDRTPILPYGWRLVLASQPRAGDDGFYFHYDDDFCYFVSQGKNQNNFNTKVIDKYAIGRDSILNIFIQVHHPDSVKSKYYKTDGQGVALGSHSKLAGIYETKGLPGHFTGLFNHEVGHMLNLGHAWVEDGCDDTPKHANKCWEWTPSSPCSEWASNNLMDYNAYQVAATPCQIGLMNQALANEKHKMRPYQVPDWCQLKSVLPIMIRDSVCWAGARDVTQNIVIESGGVLRLTCRVSMPERSSIMVNPGGRLWLDGVKLHNSCGKPWRGILINERKGKKGEVYVIQQSSVENVVTHER